MHSVFGGEYPSQSNKNWKQILDKILWSFYSMLIAPEDNLSFWRRVGEWGGWVVVSFYPNNDITRQTIVKSDHSKIKTKFSKKITLNSGKYTTFLVWICALQLYLFVFWTMTYLFLWCLWSPFFKKKKKEKTKQLISTLLHYTIKPFSSKKKIQNLYKTLSFKNLKIYWLGSVFLFLFALISKVYDTFMKTVSLF